MARMANQTIRSQTYPVCRVADAFLDEQGNMQADDGIELHG